ncbi:MAG: hypothetical protein A3K19_08725 [Lentisphaerae bacterium RIFOXYB12_FULL_65_16]|nr:MAG: hypothetical protein A3K18_05540 [Lentisphaerae bacterium RIFOXYA12_64_32]OGV89499.1 MAG: hypothetical protein A3K19_08725 [Lentisphaerae bacterium RIFOXYB12_FULL_65_16]
MKKVYMSFFLHGNMCYDRYTKQEIREKFPQIYASGIRSMHRFPEVTAHIDLPGLTVLSLKRHASWLVDQMKPLVQRGQLVMVGCQYAASHALCADEESDLLASRVTMEMLRDEFGCDINTFFPQESPYHQQAPLIMDRIGAKNLVIWTPEWKRPFRTRGLSGGEVIFYPVDPWNCRLDKLEEFYDAHEDGDFVMTGGDFEGIGNVQPFVDKIAELAKRGKIIEWMTVERYEREIGIKDCFDTPTPFGQATEDRRPSPSFSRWVGDPEDVIWHGHAVTAMEAVRAAGFAAAVAKVHRLGAVDVPLSAAWTTAPDNVWDHHFEEVTEFPETESKYLSLGGEATLLSRAWHQLIIGLNSDSSGWFPWTPRTRHRSVALRTATALAREAQVRCAQAIAAKLSKRSLPATEFVLALNPGPARTVDVAVDTACPMTLVAADGAPTPAATLCLEGKWSASARVALPAYGYKLLGLRSTQDITVLDWQSGAAVAGHGWAADLTDGRLHLVKDGEAIEVNVAPFRLSDPSGAAKTEEVTPDWKRAKTRVRQTPFGPDLEVFAELAWAVWLRLVFGVREDRVEVTAELHVDMPRRIGKLHYDPAGLLVCFKGKPGQVTYDIPYATVEHPNPAETYVAVQRFAGLENASLPFGIVCLGGNQSFMVHGEKGTLGANLGASTQGRPDTRPECAMRPDGTAEHRITSGGDPFLGTYVNRFALVTGDRTVLPLAARRLRTAVPLISVTPGRGRWPTEQSLLAIGPESVHVTAFRMTKKGSVAVLNEVQGKRVTGACAGKTVALVPYGMADVALAKSATG